MSSCHDEHGQEKVPVLLDSAVRLISGFGYLRSRQPLVPVLLRFLLEEAQEEDKVWSLSAPFPLWSLLNAGPKRIWHKFQIFTAMKKILVTGSNGLLGQKLTELILSSNRAQLIATSKGRNRYPAEEGYVYAEMDICDTPRMRDVIQRFSPDVIIHTAAVTNVDICEQDKDLCRLMNVEAVRSLSVICEENDIHLIHLSTDFVFDGGNGPYAEEADVSPVSVYGESKAESERILFDSSCRWTIIRTILVYGITTDMSRSNIVLWAKSALEKGEPLNIVADQWRMPTLAEDLAEACLLAAEREAPGIYHISGKDMMSVYELVQHVAAFWHLDSSLMKPVSSESLNQTAKRPKRTGFVLDKAIADLGYQPHSFREGLTILDAQIKKRDDRYC
ncbi:SDR family oxidoreductase [Arcticibacter tournemirensis]